MITQGVSPAAVLLCVLVNSCTLSQSAEGQDSDTKYDLVRALASSNSEVREEAEARVIEVPRETLWRVALSGLQSPDARVRAGAGRAISLRVDAYSPECLSLLVDLLEDTDPGVRDSSAIALGTVGCPEAAPALLKALESEEDELARSSCLWALSQVEPVPSEAAVALCLTELGSDSALLREAALGGLAGVPDPSAELVASVTQCLHDEVLPVRQAASAALVSFGARAVPHLVALLGDKRRLAEVLATLAELGEEATAALPLLTRLLEQSVESSERISLAHAIGRVGGERDQVAETLLHELRNAESAADRAAAARALTTFQVTEDVSLALVASACDTSWRVRREAFLALREGCSAPSARILGRLGEIAADPELDDRTRHYASRTHHILSASGE